MTDQTALRLGRQLADQLGYDLSALDEGTLAVFGRACNQAFNAWGGRTTLPTDLLSLPPHTPTAGLAGADALATPAAVAFPPPTYLGPPSWFRRFLGGPVGSTAAFRVGAPLAAAFLAGSLVGFLPIVVLVSLGFAPVAMVWMARS